MSHVSTWRLWGLRASYLLLAAGLGFAIWPSLLDPGTAAPNSSTVVHALLGALAVLAVLGLCHPLRMLPVLLFELLWKTIWVCAIALPAWRRGDLGSYGTATLYECLPAFVIFPLVIPWRYVLERYVLAPGYPWRRSSRDRSDAL